MANANDFLNKFYHMIEFHRLTANYGENYDPLSLTEDFFFPHPADERGSEVETLPEQPQVSALDDIDNVVFKCQEHLI